MKKYVSGFKSSWPELVIQGGQPHLAFPFSKDSLAQPSQILLCSQIWRDGCIHKRHLCSGCLLLICCKIHKSMFDKLINNDYSSTFTHSLKCMTFLWHGSPPLRMNCIICCQWSNFTPQPFQSWHCCQLKADGCIPNAQVDHWISDMRAGSSHWRGRLSIVDLLTKIGCFVKKKI